MGVGVTLGLVVVGCGRTVAVFDPSLAAGDTAGDDDDDDVGPDDDDDVEPDDDDDVEPDDDDDDDDDDVEPDDDDDDDDDDVEPDDDDDEPDCVDDEDCDGGVCIAGLCFDDPCRDDPCCPDGCFDVPPPPDFGDPGCLAEPRLCPDDTYCDPRGICVEIPPVADCDVDLFAFEELFSDFSDTLVGAPVAADIDEGGADELAVVVAADSSIVFVDFDAPMFPTPLFFEGVGRDLSDENLVGSPEADLALVHLVLGDAFVTTFEAGPGPSFAEVATYELPVSGGLVFGGAFNGDGFRDLAVLTDADAIPLRVLFGTGTGTFSLAAAANPPLDDPSDVVALDVTADGLDDLVVADHSGEVQLFLAQPSGVFVPGEVIDEAPMVDVARRLTTAQIFPGGPREVIAVAPRGESTAVSLIYVSGPGELNVEPPLGLFGNAAAVVAFDHDDDGIDELAVGMNPLEDGAVLPLQLLAPGLGLCGAQWDVPAPIHDLDAGDWNGDGRQGLALVSADPSYLAVIDAL